MFQTFVIQITLWFKKYKLCNTKLKHNNLVNHIVRPINNYILRHNITTLLLFPRRPRRVLLRQASTYRRVFYIEFLVDSRTLK